MPAEEHVCRRTLLPLFFNQRKKKTGRGRERKRDGKRGRWWEKQGVKMLHNPISQSGHFLKRGFTSRSTQSKTNKHFQPAPVCSPSVARLRTGPFRRGCVWRAPPVTTTQTCSWWWCLTSCLRTRRPLPRWHWPYSINLTLKTSPAFKYFNGLLDELKRCAEALVCECVCTYEYTLTKQWRLDHSLSSQHSFSLNESDIFYNFTKYNFKIQLFSAQRCPAMFCCQDICRAFLPMTCLKMFIYSSFIRA